MNMIQRNPAQEADNVEADPSYDWSAILQEHDRWLRTVIYARIRQPDALDEVMQEVALAAVRQTAPPRDPNKVAPWLYQVAVRQALMYRRKCGRQKKLKGRYVEKVPPREHDPGSPMPLDWLLREERNQLVRTALERLARRDTEILLLKYSEEWSYQQIAEHLGITAGAVEARLHRARARLRSELAREDVEGN